VTFRNKTVAASCAPLHRPVSYFSRWPRVSVQSATIYNFNAVMSRRPFAVGISAHGALNGHSAHCDVCDRRAVPGLHDRHLTPSSGWIACGGCPDRFARWWRKERNAPTICGIGLMGRFRRDQRRVAFRRRKQLSEDALVDSSRRMLWHSVSTVIRRPHHVPTPANLADTPAVVVHQAYTVKVTA